MQELLIKSLLLYEEGDYNENKVAVGKKNRNPVLWKNLIFYRQNERFPFLFILYFMKVFGI